MSNPWSEITQPSEDISARLIDYKHPLSLHWARNHLGKYLFICEIEEERESEHHKAPELTGIEANFVIVNNKKRLLLELQDQSNWEIFYALCKDIVEATRKSKNNAVAFTIIIRRLNRWHDFLKKIRSDILTEEQIKGLLGELLFIKNHLIPVFGVVDAVKFWVGPEGAAQDFNVGDIAIEAKCQAGTTNPHVKISSLEQLNTQLPSMFLYVVTLGKTTAKQQSALNLPLLIDSIRTELETTSPQQVERFNDLLFGLGYVESEKYLEYSYLLTEEVIFEITADFPRINDKAVPSGVSKVKYSINLSDCLPFLNKPKWLEK